MDIAMNETTVAVVPQDVVVMEAEAEEKQLTTQVTEIEQRANVIRSSIIMISPSSKATMIIRTPLNSAGS